MNTIETKMNEMKLYGMASSFKSLVDTRQDQDLASHELLSVLLQAEQQERANRRFRRLVYNANFRYQASVEEITLDQSRGLDKNVLASLTTGEYITKGMAVLISGATGCGKSFLASELGHQACAQGYKVAYFNTQKLMLKTKMARLEGSIFKFFEKLSKTDLVILDDFGLTHLDKQQQLDLME